MILNGVWPYKKVILARLATTLVRTHSQPLDIQNRYFDNSAQLIAFMSKYPGVMMTLYDVNPFDDIELREVDVTVGNDAYKAEFGDVHCGPVKFDAALGIVISYGDEGHGGWGN